MNLEKFRARSCSWSGPAACAAGKPMSRSNVRPQAALAVQPDLRPCMRHSIRLSALAVLCVVLAFAWAREARAVPLDDIHLAQSPHCLGGAMIREVTRQETHPKG